jgi:PBSX family phage portal protein
MSETRRRRPAPVITADGDQIVSFRGRETENDKDEVLSLVQKGEVSQQIVDIFKMQNLYGEAGDLRIIAPPVSLPVLLRFPNDSSILRQCIEAMVINIEGHGYRLEYVGPDGDEQSDAAIQEAEMIEELLDQLNPDISLMEMRKRTRWDIETLGFGFWELGRSQEGKPSFLSHLPGHTVRMTTADKNPVTVDVTTNLFGKKVVTSVRRFFRRYVQIVGTTKVYFKELGDPRSIDPKTGNENPNLAYDETATEVVPYIQYYPGQLYGLPRWFNNMVAIQTSRQAELTNLDYFKDNAIPALVVMVSGGMLSRTNIGQMEEHITAARGRQAQNRVLLLEALADKSAATKDGKVAPPTINVQPLAGERPKEGMFLELGNDCNEKVRSSFRLPPIFTGHAQDYSHASAKTSYEVAEGQVFGPERAIMDDVLNRSILSEYGVKYWEVRSNPPKMADPEEMLNAVEVFDQVGAMSPNIAIGLANEMFGLDIPLIEDDWGEYPFPIVQAMAQGGTLLGFEDITKPVEEATTALVGDTGDGGSKTGDIPASDQANQNDGASAKAEKRRRRAIRRTIGQLHDLIQTSQKSREYPNPARRRRSERRIKKVVRQQQAA